MGQPRICCRVGVPSGPVRGALLRPHRRDVRKAASTGVHPKGLEQAGVDLAFRHLPTSDLQRSGLGLSITRALLAEMGGHLEIGRYPEGGAQVDLMLPRASPR